MSGITPISSSGPRPGWTTRTIGELCDENGGDVQTGPFGSHLHAADYVDCGIPVVMPVNLIEGRITTHGIARISAADHLRLKKYHLRTGDIVYARRGDIGRLALVTEEQEGWLCGTGCLRIRLNNPSVDNRFVAYYLRLPKTKELVLSQAVGTTLPNLNTSILRSIPIELPPLSVQRRIAEILGTLDDKIELNRRMNETLEQMAMALYKHWFVDFGPFEDGEFVESEIGMIPKGWEVKSIGEVTENYDSKRIPLSSMERAKRQGPYPYYGAAGIVDHVDGYLFDGIFLLIGEDGSVVRPNGKPFIQYVEGKFWVNNHAHVIQGKGLISTEWLKLFFETVDITPYVTGAVQPKLTKSNLNSLKLVVPPMEESKEFAKQISDLFAMIRANARETVILTQTRDYLLPRLLSGEIELDQAEEQVEEVI